MAKVKINWPPMSMKAEGEDAAVRAADAAGLSYGVWRAREDDRKRKAKEAIHRKIEERKKKHGESKDQLAAHEHESRG